MPRKKPSSGQNKEIQAKIAAKFGKTSSRTGGRGSVRRKFKAPPKSSMQDDKRLQGQLKKLNVNPIPAIEEVNLFKDDETVVHFTKPKVQAEISSNTYVISGQCETKKLQELIPQILPQLGREHIDSLKNFANAFTQLPENDDEDDVPVLVDDNFEAVASSDQKNEKTDDANADTTEATDANANANANANTNANADATANGNTDADATAASGDPQVNGNTPQVNGDKPSNDDTAAPAVNDDAPPPAADDTTANANENEKQESAAGGPTSDLKPDTDAEVSV